MAKSKKLLALPPTMVAASRMNTRLKNKDQHPGIVDDWENPDDMETGAERLKRREEKKTQNCGSSEAAGER